MTSIAFEIAFIAVLILANGILSMAEMSLVSARRSLLEQASEDGDVRAKKALDLSRSPNRFLSMVQIGISLIGVLSGAVGGATLAEQVSAQISSIKALAPISEELGVIVVVLVITYFTLVLGELIPKRIAMYDPEKMARNFAAPMGAISRFAEPLINLLSASTNLGLRAMGFKGSDRPEVTEEELRSMMEQASRNGVILQVEQEIMESIFRLSDRRVDAIMTSRTEIVWLDTEVTLQENYDRIVSSRHNQFPVCKGSLDDVQGVILGRDIMTSLIKDGELSLRSLCQAPLFLPESSPALQALDTLKKTSTHMAIVLDEFGGVSGMITLQDILRSVIGEFTDDGGEIEPMVLQREDGSWLVDGLLQTDELKELLHLEDLPEEERLGYQTLGGMMMSALAQVPVGGQYLEWQGYRFEVIDMDNRRVDKVLVTSTGTDGTNSGAEAQA